MGWLNLIDRITGNTVAAADVNTLSENVRVLGGNGVNAPSSDIETLSGLIVPYLNAVNIYGLEISNGTDTEHDIDIAIGGGMDSTRNHILELTSGLTKQIDATWAAGDAAGGLDTGTVAVDTWYYVFAILKDSDSSVDILFSASKTAPTMPTGYTYFRRIRGALLTDASANILNFYQKDNRFWFNSRIHDLSTTSNVTTRILTTISAPPNMVGMVKVQLNDNAISYVLIGSVVEDDIAPSQTDNDLFSNTSSNAGQLNCEILTDSSSQLYHRASQTLSNFWLDTRGFIDDATS